MRGIIGLKFEWWFNDCNESLVNASRLALRASDR